MIPEEGPDKYYYYHYNHKGDVSALTDGDEKLAAYYEYDAWGNTMTEAEKSGVDNPYRYSTKEWDEKSSLYYSPQIGRWTQRDPAGTVDGLNLHSYVSNDPVGGIEPEGKHWYWPLHKNRFHRKAKKPTLRATLTEGLYVAPAAAVHDASGGYQCAPTKAIRYIKDLPHSRGSSSRVTISLPRTGTTTLFPPEILTALRRVSSSRTR